MEAKGVGSPEGGEKLSISLLDSIAIHWLITIDRRLINIVKTEFSSELKTKRICQMIKPIATNIDDLLVRYSNRDSVNIVNSQVAPSSIPETNIPTSGHNDVATIDMIIRRIEKLEYNKPRSSRFNRRNNKGYYSQKQQMCVHCALLNKQLGASLNTNHHASVCTKKKLSVSLIETVEDPELSLSDSSADFIQNEGDISNQKQLSYNDIFQTSDQQDCSSNVIKMDPPLNINKCSRQVDKIVSGVTANTISDKPHQAD